MLVGEVSGVEGGWGGVRGLERVCGVIVCVVLERARSGSGVRAVVGGVSVLREEGLVEEGCHIGGLRDGGFGEGRLVCGQEGMQQTS